MIFYLPMHVSTKYLNNLPNSDKAFFFAMLLLA